MRRITTTVNLHRPSHLPAHNHPLTHSSTLLLPPQTGATCRTSRRLISTVAQDETSSSASASCAATAPLIHSHSHPAIVDWNGWQSWDREDERRAATKLVDTLRNIGFIYLRNSPLTPKLIEETLEQTRWFFSLPSSLHSTIATPNSRRGYYRYESAAGDVDSIAAFNVGAEGELDGHCRPQPWKMKRQYFEKLYEGIKDGGNIWREDANQRNLWLTDEQVKGADAFRSHLLSYFDSCHRTLHLLLRLSYMGLFSNHAHHDDSIDPFTRAHSFNDSVLELKSYPPIRLQPNEDNSNSSEFSDPSRMRLPAHTDLTSFTLLIQDREQGLEVFNKQNGTFESALADPSMVLVHTGDILQQWSAALLQEESSVATHSESSSLHVPLPSTPHRVHAASGSFTVPRVSVVYFGTPDLHTSIPSATLAGQMREGYQVGDRMPF